MTIGKRIKAIRERLGMSQVDFADKINVSKQTLYKYENDIITNIPSDKIENIAALGDISPAYIMGWNEDYYLGENLQNIFEILSKEFSTPANELIRCFFSENFTDLLPSKKYITLDNMRNALKTYFTLYASNNDILTQDEYEHIKKYRTLDLHGKDMVDTVLDKEVERMAEIKINKNSITEFQPHLEVNAAHARTDINIPEGIDTSEDDIMKAEDF